MPFFLVDKKKNSRKRKADGIKSRKNGMPKTKKSKKVEDEEITSESEHESDHVEKKQHESDDETPEEIRKRAAEKLLAQKAAALKEKDIEDNDQLSAQLRQEHRERIGRQFKHIADLYEPPNEEDIRWCRWCKLDVVTCITVMPDGSAIFTGSKDGSIVKWSSVTCEKLYVVHGIRKKHSRSTGHDGAVLALAVSYNGKFLASGGKDTNIYVWNPKDCQLIHTLNGHRSAIISLVFRDDSHDLFSCSERISNSALMKIWNLDEMAIMDTISAPDFSAVDCLKGNKPITACGRDSNIIVWKLDKNENVSATYSGRRDQQNSNNISSKKVQNNPTTLIHCAAIDCIRYIDDQHAISGACDNSIAIWKLPKSRYPVATVRNAHDGRDSSKLNESWITSVASIRRSDLVASGSHDGFVKFWKCEDDFRSIKPLFSVPVDGFINGLEFSSKGNFIVAAVGKQQRLGRWIPSFKNSSTNNGQGTVRNGVCIIQLRQKTPDG